MPVVYTDSDYNIDKMALDSQGRIDPVSNWSFDNLSFAINAILPNTLIRLERACRLGIPKGYNDKDAMALLTGSSAEMTYIPPYAHIQKTGQDFVMGKIHNPDLDYLVDFRIANDYKVETENSPPGFCKLINKETSQLFPPTSLIERDTDHTHGPAVKLDTLDVEFDLVPSLFYKHDHQVDYLNPATFEDQCRVVKDGDECNFRWPSQTQNFFLRYRPSGWPSRITLDQIQRNGYHIVPAVHASKTLQSMYRNWRFSFSLAESQLTTSLNDTQRRCYILLKMYKKTCWSDFEFLSSYQLKNTLFWACEQIPKERWTEETIGEMMTYLLDKLLHYVTIGNLPQYFIPEHNLLYAVPLEGRKTLLRKILEVRKNPVENLLKFTDHFRFLGGPITTDLRCVLENVIKDKSGESKICELYSSESLALAGAYLKDLIIWIRLSETVGLNCFMFPHLSEWMQGMAEGMVPWDYMSLLMEHKATISIPHQVKVFAWNEWSLGIGEEYRDWDMETSPFPLVSIREHPKCQEEDFLKRQETMSFEMKYQDLTGHESSDDDSSSDVWSSEESIDEAAFPDRGIYCIFQCVLMVLGPFMCFRHFVTQAKPICSLQKSEENKDYEDIFNRLLPSVFAAYKEEMKFDFGDILHSLRTKSQAKILRECLDHICSDISRVPNVLLDDKEWEGIGKVSVSWTFSKFMENHYRLIQLPNVYESSDDEEFQLVYIKCQDAQREGQLSGIVLFIMEFCSSRSMFQTITAFLKSYAAENRIDNMSCALLMLLVDMFPTIELFNTGCRYILSAAAHFWPHEDIKQDAIYPAEYLLTKLRSSPFWEEDLVILEDTDHPINSLTELRNQLRRSETRLGEKGQFDVDGFEDIMKYLKRHTPSIFSFSVFGRIESRRHIPGLAKPEQSQANHSSIFLFPSAGFGTLDSRKHVPGLGNPEHIRTNEQSDSIEHSYANLVHALSFFLLILYPKIPLTVSCSKFLGKSQAFPKVDTLFDILHKVAISLSSSFYEDREDDDEDFLESYLHLLPKVQPFYFLFHKIEFMFGMLDPEQSLNIYLETAFPGLDSDLALGKMFHNQCGTKCSFPICKAKIVEQLLLCKQTKLPGELHWSDSLFTNPEMVVASPDDVRRATKVPKNWKEADAWLAGIKNQFGDFLTEGNSGQCSKFRDVIEDHQGSPLLDQLECLAPDVGRLILALAVWDKYIQKTYTPLQFLPKLKRHFQVENNRWKSFLSFVSEFYSGRNVMNILSIYTRRIVNNHSTQDNSLVISPEHVVSLCDMDMITQCDDKFKKLRKTSEAAMMNDLWERSGHIQLQFFLAGLSWEKMFSECQETQAFHLFEALRETTGISVKIPHFPEENCFIALLMLLNRYRDGSTHLQLYIWRLEILGSALCEAPLKLLKTYLKKTFIVHEEQRCFQDIGPTAMYQIALTLLLGELYPLEDVSKAIERLTRDIGHFDTEDSSSIENLARRMVSQDLDSEVSDCEDPSSSERYERGFMEYFLTWMVQGLFDPEIYASEDSISIEYIIAMMKLLVTNPESDSLDSSDIECTLRRILPLEPDFELYASEDLCMVENHLKRKINLQSGTKLSASEAKSKIDAILKTCAYDMFQSQLDRGGPDGIAYLLRRMLFRESSTD